jgi:transposase InsO family protein
MPWKETHVLEERVKFVNAAIEGAWPFADLCRSHGISRKTGYKFLERYERYGLEGLVDRSRARFEQADRTPDHIVDRIVEERRAHPYWGPRKILRYLQRTNPSILDWPAISTAGEILKRHGLVQDRKTKRRTPSGIPRDPARADRPNLVWCADFKGHFRTGDGSRCDPLTVSDDFSRFVLGCRCVAGLGFEHVKPAFIRIFEQYGLPQVIRTDNGAPFASTGIGGLSPLSVWWIKLGITPQRIDPGQPQQQGAHERMHRTLKNETVVPPKADLRSQQKAFDKFRKEYNNDRPHEALGDRTPAEFYSPSPKPFPAHEPEAAYPSHYEVRRVERKGSLKFANKDIFLGSALATELVGFESASDHHWRIYFRHIPVAIFDTESKKILRFALFTGE